MCSTLGLRDSTLVLAIRTDCYIVAVLEGGFRRGSEVNRLRLEGMGLRGPSE